MRLKKLTLKNIASIEEAEIDFSASPLKEESLFLICGKTGSGKTTILDGICLALYGNTPRMNRTAKEEYKENPQSTRKHDMTLINDSRQLMRRNTVEAWSILEFEGSNGHDYRAKWYVKCARKKLSEGLMKAEWSLENLTTEEYWNKPTEIPHEIHKAVGLTFDQYCRTAMLAQGEFTLFLQSREAEKSEILEKLTGTEIYSQIGSRIFRKTKEKKLQLENQQQKLSDIQILSEEEITVMNQQVLEGKELLKSNQEISRTLQGKKDWLVRNEQLSSKKDSLLESWQLVHQMLQSEETRNMEQILALWNQTEEIRSVNKLILNLEQERNLHLRKEAELANQFTRAQKGRAFFQKEMTGLDNRIRQVQKQLQEQQEWQPMFEKSADILSHTRLWQKNQEKIAECDRKTSQISQQLPQLKQQEEERKKEYEERYLKLEQLKKQIETLRTEIQKANMNELQEKQKQFFYQSRVLIKAQQIILLLKEHLNQKQKTEKELEEKREHMKALLLQEKTLADQTKLATESFKQTEELYNKQQLALSDWAREVRQQLQPGDSCPVCGTTISQYLREENFVSLLAPLQKDLEDKKALKEKAERDLLSLQASIHTMELQLAELEKKGLEAQTNYRNTYQNTVEACAACGILQLQKQTQQEIDQRIGELEKEQQKNASILEETQKKIAHLTNEEQEKDKEQKVLENILKQVHQLEKEKQEAESRMKDFQSQKQKETEEAGLLMETLKKEVISGEWFHLLETSPAHFIQSLEKGTNDFRLLQDTEKKLLDQMNLMNLEEERLKEQERQILLFFPSWNATTENSLSSAKDTDTPRLENLEAYWKKLTLDCSSYQERLQLLTQQKQQQEELAKRFYEKNPELQPDNIRILDNYSGQQIDELRKKLQGMKEKELTQRTQLESIKAEWLKWQEEKPELTEQDNLENLQRELETIEMQVSQTHQQMGRLEAQLEQHNANLEKKAEIIKLVQQLEEDYLHWTTLCSMFGDDKGKKFRNIAQSFVLRELLQRANYYLNFLTDRYELTCLNDSLTILLIDWFQGGVKRPASTLSGGESFLVSLSLALGLSSLNRQSISVDTLFIDEGFGTLSSDYLNVVMNTLERLHQLGGKKVGIISHVEGLRERIKTQIQVKRIDQGRSEVQIVTVL